MGEGPLRYYIGPRKVTKIGGRPAIYLPKKLHFLRGKTVQLIVEIIDGDGNEQPI